MAMDGSTKDELTARIHVYAYDIVIKPKKVAPAKVVPAKVAPSIDLSSSDRSMLGGRYLCRSAPRTPGATARVHVYASDSVIIAIVSADDDMLGERVLKESFERES
jgi:hypothetical protein